MQKTDSQTPLVSVLMPVYNAQDFLEEALDSILEQSFKNFELIAIDDGSKDSSGKILDNYASRDGRVRVIHQKNQGLVATLNTAISLSKGEYLARQDADDVSFPRRFELQAKVLTEDPDVVLVSGGFEVFDTESEFLYREVLQTEDDDIRRAMYLRNPIGHGSVMFRKDACFKAGLYQDNHGPTEDYELWLRLSRLGKLAAVEQAVFHWRVNPQGITSTKNTVMVEIMREHKANLWKELPPPFIPARMLRQRGLFYYETHKKRGVDMKNNMLADNAQISLKMMRNGHFFLGVRQLVAVALVGRSGLRAVWHRIRVVRQSGISAIRKKATFGRQEPA